MSIDERLDKITQTLEYLLTLQQSHDDHIGTLTPRMDETAQRMDETAKRMDETAKRMDVLTQRTIQAMDAINRLAHIAQSHDHRLEDLESGRPF